MTLTTLEFLALCERYFLNPAVQLRTAVIQARVAGLLDFAHAATAKRRQNLVTAQRRAGLQPHKVATIMSTRERISSVPVPRQLAAAT